MGKYSKYNFLFQNGNKGVLFNLTTSRVMVLDEKIVEIIKQHKENIDFIKDISSPLYEEMEKNGILSMTNATKLRTSLPNGTRETKANLAII